ncbi:CLUMA_CG013974, isoform A [Clunio marinus]|uniref:CLUMA_CG013974, isoform A n=1 Tax=Clunio marinus TaxID=568069 RepID=A0A1J1IKE4_9DIPT|nr:CLUMA_CG013974, isoform A [Clunio marinus]
MALKCVNKLKQGEKYFEIGLCKAQNVFKYLCMSMQELDVIYSSVVSESLIQFQIDRSGTVFKSKQLRFIEPNVLKKLC